jgi:nucleotide-binding universal stress UspA family protein
LRTALIPGTGVPSGRVKLSAGFTGGLPASLGRKPSSTTYSALAKTAGVACTGVIVSSDFPYQMIIHNAQKRKCDLIMMASHGRRGLSGLLLGSETAKVLTHSKIPVLVVR